MTKANKAFEMKNVCFVGTLAEHIMNNIVLRVKCIITSLVLAILNLTHNLTDV